MIEIRIPKEITDFKEKLFFGMTIRQLAATLIIVALNIPLYIKGKDYLGDDLTSWIVILNALPLSLLGFFKYNQMTFEKFLKVMIEFHLLAPRKRPYKTENFYEILLSEEDVDDSRMGKKRKKEKEYTPKKKRRGLND